eukprot:4027589-Pyramimonas_sp.AAC.1
MESPPPGFSSESSGVLTRARRFSPPAPLCWGGGARHVARRGRRPLIREAVVNRENLTWFSRAGTACFYVSRPPRDESNMVVPSCHHAFLLVQATRGATQEGHLGGYLTWLPRAGPTCVNVSRPPRGVFNMMSPDWSHVVSRPPRVVFNMAEP